MMTIMIRENHTKGLNMVRTLKMWKKYLNYI